VELWDLEEEGATSIMIMIIMLSFVHKKVEGIIVKRASGDLYIPTSNRLKKRPVAIYYYTAMLLEGD
jgi:hypothetical protein